MLEGLFQPLHLFVVLVVVLVIFGPSRLPELGESLGRSIRAFKKGLEEPKSLASPKADHRSRTTRRPDPSEDEDKRGSLHHPLTGVDRRNLPTGIATGYRHD